MLLAISKHILSVILLRFCFVYTKQISTFAPRFNAKIDFREWEGNQK